MKKYSKTAVIKSKNYHFTICNAFLYNLVLIIKSLKMSISSLKN